MRGEFTALRRVADLSRALVAERRAWRQWVIRRELRAALEDLQARFPYVLETIPRAADALGAAMTPVLGEPGAGAVGVSATLDRAERA